MGTYTLSIEDRVGRGVNVTERAVVVKNPGFIFEQRYNPNAKSTKPFNSESDEFDTPFSIRHPFRTVAQVVAEHYLRNGGLSSPEMKYDMLINDAQKTLFENILAQECDAVKKQENEGDIPRRGIHLIG